MKHLLFTYGTLRAQHRNSLANGLEPSQLVAEGVTLPDFAIFNLGWFPGIQPKQGAVTVGDVWLIDEAQFPGLDRYEGVPTLYTRQQVEHPDFPEQPLNVYVYAQAGAVDRSVIIEDGDWLAQQKRLQHVN